MHLENFIELSEEVDSALKQKKPVVALESSVFCQGLPKDRAFLAQTIFENSVRENEAIPACISIFEGRVLVGTPKQVVQDLISLKSSPRLIKVSSRDIAGCLAQKLCGGTTVSATCLLASLVGIKVFATGGIGGVHRGHTWDISADLAALSQFPLIVVSAGIKSILDVPKTLEILEAAQVPVFSYKSLFFPNFYCQSNKLKSQNIIHNLSELVKIYQIRQALKQKEAILLAQAVDNDLAIDEALFEKALACANLELQKKHLSSKDLTPFLLEHVVKNTNFDLVSANIELIKNNAALAAKLSALLA